MQNQEDHKVPQDMGPSSEFVPLPQIGVIQAKKKSGRETRKTKAGSQGRGSSYNDEDES
jgi:hypothetical protein